VTGEPKGPTSGTSRQRIAAVLARPGVSLLIFVVAISIVAGLLEPSFFTVNNWVNMVNQMIFVLIVGIGMTVVLIGGGIDLSVGSIVGLSGGVTAWLMGNGVPLGAAVVVGIVTGLGLGIVNGLVITRLKIPDFIATLATLAVIRGLLHAWTEGVPFTGYSTEGYRLLAGLDPLVWRITVPMIVAAGVAALAALMLRYTSIGRHIRATGSNREAASLAGVRVNGVKILLYAGSGTLAGLAGILLAGRLDTVQPQMGADLMILAIAAAILGGAALTGGRGSILGAVVGAFTLILIQNLVNLFNITPAWEPLIIGVVILAAVVFNRTSTLVVRRASKRKAEGVAA